MKIEVKKLDGLRRELKFEIPKDRVSQTMRQVYDEIGRVAKIKGFRPGKAPRHVVETHHNKLAEEEALKKLIPEIYHEGIQKEKINPLDFPEIENVLFKDGIITFTATLDIKPEIKLKQYKGIKVERKSSQVTEEEINKTLDFIKKGQGQDKEVTIDDQFAHGLGYPNLEEFKKFLARQMETDKDRQNRIDVENQIVEDLLKQGSFDVPQSLVKKQIERRVADAKKHWRSHRLSEAEITKKEEELRQDKKLQAGVQKDIKVYLIFDKIAELENIQVQEGENMPGKVMELLLKEAQWETK
ncbi:MAG: hypothetical protein A3D10_02965 [Omnitrophica WOR_2 bacterium RIFCSPHIGHO2_02_FULL_48_11]|nr:MAG: hypothetical protein A3D10_02965 [Omnitrophica WOR_2 bacterium RIFCSPHIGHO2_02_FULL_48_11]